MATDRNPEILALWAQVDDATNAIAARIQSDIDDGVTAENVDAFVAKMQAHVVRLQALGSNPANPIPPEPVGGQPLNAPRPQGRNPGETDAQFQARTGGKGVR